MLFAGQEVHVVLPHVSLYVFAKQSVHTPGLPVVPGPQGGNTQTADEVLPGGARLPLGQAVHAAEPVLSLYVFAGHCVQAPGLPVNPSPQGGNVQAADEVLPGALVLPLGHEVHAVLPVEDLYVFAGHCVQAPGLPVNPSPQGGIMQADNAVLPAGAVPPLGQGAHTNTIYCKVQPCIVTEPSDAN